MLIHPLMLVPLMGCNLSETVCTNPWVDSKPPGCVVRENCVGRENCVAWPPSTVSLPRDRSSGWLLHKVSPYSKGFGLHMSLNLFLNYPVAMLRKTILDNLLPMVISSPAKIRFVRYLF